MKHVPTILRMPVGARDIDDLLMRTAELICFAAGLMVFILGLLKTSRLDLSEAQFFSSVLQVIQTSLLLCVMGLLLERKRKNL